MGKTFQVETKSDSMKLSRRDFLKLSAGSTAALGLVLMGFPNFERILADSVEEYPVIWLQGGSCSGCSVSVLNSLSPKIQDVLVSQVVSGKHVSLRFHPTVMAAAGDTAMKALEDTARNKKGSYILVVEGSIPTKNGGVYCEVGEKNGIGIPFLEHVTTLGRDAMAVIAIGTCAVSGGIPSAAPNFAGYKGVSEIFAESGISTPVINLPGCPTHPDWFISTVATVLIGGLGAVETDSVGRPLAFYGGLIHDNCPRRGYFDAGKFAKHLSEPYCLYQLGCKGPVTHADCPVRLWNSGTNWCVGANSPCIGCAEPGFPDIVSPFKELAPLYNITPPSWLPPVQPSKTAAPSEGIGTGAAVGIGVAGIAVGAAGLAAAHRIGRSQPENEDKE
jgi:hydrogenase small subunit